jgi:thiol-disulfide isomerase/thioredoxin
MSPAPLPRPAPNFSLKTPAGEMLVLGSLKGKAVLIDFWATWCKPCVKSMPDVQKLYTKLGEKGLDVVGIAIDEEGTKAVAPFLSKSKTKFTYPMVLDPTGETWKAWGVKMIPFLALVKEGQIVKQWSGTPDFKEVERAALAAIGDPRHE